MQAVMFNVKKFSVCQVTGFTDIQLEFDAPNGNVVDTRSFRSKEDADRYILSTKHSYIVHKLERFVQHKKILVETGRRDFYVTEKRFESLEKCWKAVCWAQDQPFKRVCQVILQIKDQLYNILPSPSNVSYSSSVRELEEIIAFCAYVA